MPVISVTDQERKENQDLKSNICYKKLEATLSYAILCDEILELINV